MKLLPAVGGLRITRTELDTGWVGGWEPRHFMYSCFDITKNRTRREIRFLARQGFNL